jgi:hypothetical protein
MRTTRVQILLASLVVCALAATSARAQTAEANYKFERGFPVADTAKRAYDASDLRRAIEAYKFFYPTISTEAVMQQGQAAGAKLNEVGIVMATSPRQQFGAANADTPYAITGLVRDGGLKASAVGERIVQPNPSRPSQGVGAAG